MLTNGRLMGNSRRELILMPIEYVLLVERADHDDPRQSNVGLEGAHVAIGFPSSFQRGSMTERAPIERGPVDLENR
jgi:hypothetical protein